MRNIKFFEREINLIADEELRMCTKSLLEMGTCDYFWTESASSSGKHHSAFSQGVGGLVRHTKAVVMFAEELLRMNPYVNMKDEYKDYVIAACLLHDTYKYGIYEYDKSEFKNHAENAANCFEEWCHEEDYQPHYLLLQAIRSHMGQWSTNKEDCPFTLVDKCVHMADYMASRPFIDIPTITEEYNKIFCQ